jgi:tetratricopeptide (TPR) repeat protein
MLTKKLLFFIPFLIFSQSFLDFKQDTLYQRFNIDDVLLYKKNYEKKISKNLDRQNEIAEVGMKVNAEILNSKFSKGVNQDFMIIRAAEYINERVEIDYGNEIEKYYVDIEKYEKDLENYEKDSTKYSQPVEPKFPIKKYSESLELYDRVINEFADGEMIDDALYLKAQLLREMDDYGASIATFNELIDKYPDSRYTPHALMSLAEYYFNPSEERDEDDNLEALKRAIILYKKALRYTDSYRYDEALYRLGWANYRLAVVDPTKYQDAIYYFVRAIDDIYKAKKLDPQQKRSRHEILAEAIQYVGISFYYAETDEAMDAIGQITAFTKKLIEEDKDYAAAIMRSLGDVYYNIQSDPKTIEAYSKMQELFPYYKDAADIQYRIVEAYRGDDGKFKYKSESSSFSERYKLFKKYNSKSKWYNDLSGLNIEHKFAILSKAEKNAERALSENIILLYQDTQDKEEDKVEWNLIKDDYIKLVDYCREFLDHFPVSDAASKIHFNMAVVLDNKLAHFEDSYEEFITISNSYPDAEDKLVKDAAINAVLVADTLLALSGQKNRSFEFDLEKSSKAEELSLAEKRMIEAYENYIKISPNDERTAKYLANISAIYYNRKQFTLANRYNKTLLKRFPRGSSEGVARKQLLNGYLAKRQFLSAETIARKIMKDPKADKELVDYAKLRLFDAILLNARSYEVRKKYFIAGLEFRRAAEDAPFEKREDYINRSLMKSGESFDKVKEYEQAIYSYEKLISQSEKYNPYTRKAFINLSYDYEELKMTKKSAEISEKLYLDYPDSSNAKRYLYNASVLYEKSKSWKDAIRINNMYANKFPADKHSKDMLFYNASYYLKLDDFENANEIYQNFARRYPNDPRTIQAFYERGKYYLDKKEIVSAKNEFHDAIERNEVFKKKKLEMNNFYAAESSYELIQLIEKDYKAIRFTWPKRNIEKQQKEKKSVLSDLMDKYSKLISYASPRAIEAPFRIAEAYEEFAHTYADQEINPNERNITKRIVEKQKIRNGAANLYNQAINEYRSSFKATDKIIATLLKEDPEKKEKTDSLEFKRSNEINLDSLRTLAYNFIDLAKERVTSLVFTVAKQSEDNIEAVVNLKTDYHGKIGKERLDFLARRQILKKNVQIQVDKSIKAYRRNLETSKEFNLENKYTEESKRRMVLNNNVIANEYQRLAVDALKQYRIYFDEYNKLIPKPYGRKSKRLRKIYEDIGPDIEDFLTYAAEDIVNSVQAYKQTIESAKEDSIENDLTEYTELSILNGPLEFSKTLESILAEAKELKKHYLKNFTELSKDPNNVMSMNYEDAYNFMETVELSIADNIGAVLDEAYVIAQEKNLPKVSAYNQILKRLIKIDPAFYAGGIPRTTTIISSDVSWLATTEQKDSWVSLGFDDSKWKKSIILDDTTNFEAFDSLSQKVHSIWYYANFTEIAEIDSSEVTNYPAFDLDEVSGKQKYYELDSLGTKKYFTDIDTASGLPLNFVPEFAVKKKIIPVDTLDNADVYLRKKFSLPGIVYSANFFGTGDGFVDLFLNNHEILSFAGTNYGEIEIGDKELFGGYFKIGDNILGIHVNDETKPRKGVKFFLKIETLPEEFSKDEIAFNDETTFLNKEKEAFIQTVKKNRLVTEALEKRMKPKAIKKEKEKNKEDQKKNDNKVSEEPAKEEKINEDKKDDNKSFEKTDEIILENNEL